MNKIISSLEGPILIIGGSGFIGSNLLHQIISIRPDVFGTTFSGDSWRLKDIPSANIHFCNLQDGTSLHAILNKINPKTIFDCSSFGAYSFEKKYDRIHTTNYICLIQLLEIVTKKKITAYIHAGSSSEYGTNASGPDESAPLEPNSHYAVSKGAAALAIHYFGKIKKLPVVNLRLYSVYGPYEDSSRMIPELCRQSLEGCLPPFANATTARDFIYIDDVTKAFYLAATRMNKSFYGESFNIGTGIQTTLEELAILAKQLFHINEKPMFSISQSRSWDINSWYANSKKAQKILGWEPIISLQEGLILTQKWWEHTLKQDNHSLLTKKAHTQKTKNSISAIVACYKDSQAIPIIYARLINVFTRLELDYEIIFVNDCSPDDSTEIITNLSSKDIHVVGITHSRNFGSQASFRSGMELSSKEAVVLLDGDLQDPPELIEQFVQEWRKGADVVYGHRVKREMPKWLELFYKIFYFLFAKMSEIPIPKDAGDFSLIDQKVVYWMLQCKERDAFLRGLRAYVGFKQVPVDYIRPERMFGISTNNWIKNIGWAKKAIFSFTRIPLHLLTSFGLCSTLVTILIIFWAIITKIFFPETTPKGLTFLILLILFFGSSTLLALGLLGEYIGKIFEETKARPPFIRKEIIIQGKKTIIPNNSFRGL